MRDLETVNDFVREMRERYDYELAELEKMRERGTLKRTRPLHAEVQAQIDLLDAGALRMNRNALLVLLTWRSRARAGSDV